MKKALFRIFMLISIMTLVIAPTAAFASDNQAVLTMSTDTTKEYTFLPNDYALAPSGGLMLANDAQLWTVPAGKTFSFCSEYQTGTLMKFRIVRIAPSAVVTESYDSSGLYAMTIPAINEDATYMVTVYNQSSNTAYIHNYTGIVE